MKPHTITAEELNRFENSVHIAAAPYSNGIKRLVSTIVINEGDLLQAIQVQQMVIDGVTGQHLRKITSTVENLQEGIKQYNEII